MSLSPDVLIITVNYHTETEVETLIGSLVWQAVPWELVILDNGSTRAGRLILDRATAANPAVRYRDCGSNLGYFGAADFFVRCLTRNLPNRGMPDWLILTNPDVAWADDFLERLVAVDADVVAPRILDAGSGRDLNPFLEKRPSLSYVRSRRLVFSNPVIAQAWITVSWLTRRLRQPEILPPTPRPIYAAHGAVMAFRKTYFESGGSLYHEPFLFGEEMTVGERVRTIGGSVYYAPTVVATHTGHVTTGIRRSRMLLSYQRDSARYVERLIREGS
jgi:GT2 family glycosyltransferase